MLGNELQFHTTPTTETIEDVEQSTRAEIKTKYHGQFVRLVVFVFAWYVGYAILLYFKSNIFVGFGFVGFGHLNIFILATPFFIYSAWYRSIKNKIADEFMKQFAASNGYTYAAIGTVDGLAGPLFSIGYDHNIEDVVSGVYQNYPIRLFTYHFTVRQGKSQHTYSASIFEVTFQTHLPNVLLKAQEQGFMFYYGQALALPPEIRLEDSLSKVFRLYADKGYEIEALQIFTPELLEHLIALPKHYSLEFINDKLFIYSAAVITKRNDLNNMYAVAQELSVHLGPFLSRLKDDVEALNEAYRK